MPPAPDNQGEYPRGRHVVLALHAHVVFVTTYRRAALDTDMPRPCQDATPKCAATSAELPEFNSENDHVHLLAEYPPKVAVPALANNLRGMPARELRSEFTGRVNRHIRHGHFWSRFSFTAPRGSAPLSIIRHYTEQPRYPVSTTSGPTSP